MDAAPSRPATVLGAAGGIHDSNVDVDLPFERQPIDPMPPPSPLVGTASITENMLKRKWSACILRYLAKGITDPAEIAKHEPELSAAVMSERLRAMLRYDLIARYPQPAPSKTVEFRPTPRGKKILKMLDVIDRLDQLDPEVVTSLPAGATLTPEYISIGGVIDRKLAGLRVYASQHGRLFGGDDPMTRDVRDHAARVGRLGGVEAAERYWRVTTNGTGSGGVNS